MARGKYETSSGLLETPGTKVARILRYGLQDPNTCRNTTKIGPSRRRFLKKNAKVYEIKACVKNIKKHYKEVHICIK